MNFQTNLLITLTALTGSLQDVKVTPDTLKCKFFPKNQVELASLNLTGFSTFISSEDPQSPISWLNASDIRNIFTSEVLGFSIPNTHEIEVTVENYKLLLSTIEGLKVDSAQFQFSAEFLNYLEKPPLDTRLLQVLVPLPEDLVQAFKAWDTESRNTVLYYALWLLSKK